MELLIILFLYKLYAHIEIIVIIIIIYIKKLLLLL